MAGPAPPVLTLVGADLHITCLERSQVGKGSFRKVWWRYTCTCRQGIPWRQDRLTAEIRTEVHARLHHGAEPVRDWRLQGR